MRVVGETKARTLETLVGSRHSLLSAMTKIFSPPFDKKKTFRILFRIETGICRRIKRCTKIYSASGCIMRLILVFIREEITEALKDVLKYIVRLDA